MTTPLLKRAYLFLEDAEWASADEYADKVLDQDPENAEAYLVKLLSELHCTDKEKLMEQKEPFDQLNFYKKVLRFADPELKQEIEEYNTQISREKTYKVANYLLLCAVKEEEYRNAAEKYSNILGYKDADEKLAECIQRAEELNAKTARRKKRNKRLLRILVPFFILVYIVSIAVNLYSASLPNSISVDELTRFYQQLYDDDFQLSGTGDLLTDGTGFTTYAVTVNTQNEVVQIQVTCIFDCDDVSPYEIEWISSKKSSEVNLVEGLKLLWDAEFRSLCQFLCDRKGTQYFSNGLTVEGKGWTLQCTESSSGKAMIVASYSP